MEQNTHCRLCAEERDSFVRIYEEEGQKLNLATKIIQCLQIWLYPEDPLPKAVCIDCCAKLNQYFDFFETTSRAQLSLQIMFDPKVPNKPMKKEFDVNPLNKSCQETSVISDFEDDVKSQSRTPENNETDAELPEFVECVLSEKDTMSHNRMETSTSSRRKCRYPIKRTASTAKEKNTPKERATAKTRVSKTAPREQVASCDVTASQETMPLKERLLIREKINNCKVDKKCSESDLNNDTLEAICDKDRYINEGNVLEIEESGVLMCDEAVDKTDQPKTDKNKNTRKKREAKNGEKPTRPKAVLEGYPWQCVTCPVVLGSLQELRQHHQDVHHQPPTFKCIQCTKTYTRYRSFARHVKLHRNPKKFKCEECGKCFSQKTVLQSHRTVHTDARPHVCPQCGKAFKQFSSLYLHSKCHLPDQVKPKFPCDICQKDFATKHTLETHRKIHTGERNFICDMCGKSFIAKGSLDYHILTHSGEKPHHCPVCGKGFKTARLLGKHATLHTGVKPHQCDVCGKQFRERGALREHNRIHTGAMPYTCEFCGKNFRFKGILTVHRRQHTGERPYSCAECRREFTNWANYNKHMKRRHRNQDESLSSNTNRISATRTYQPLSGVAAGAAAPAPSCTIRPVASQQSVNSIPAIVSVTSLSNSYNLNQHSAISDNSNHSNNRAVSMNHVSMSPTAGPMSSSVTVYGPQNHMTKMPNIYVPHAAGDSMSSGVPNKIPPTSLSNVFHGNTNIVGNIGNNGQKVTTLGNVFHGNQPPDSQDGLERNMERPPPNPLMSSYHVPSYVSAGLPMGSMGYYIPPIHHADHGIDMLHNRMGSGQ